jgi:hypothetical protein
MSTIIITVVIAQQGIESIGAGQSKPNIAVINLKNSAGVAAGESELISDRLRGDLFNTGKVNVMERDQMQEILKEQGFQASGACNDESCLVQMGQLLGVHSLATGSIGKVGSMFLVNVRMIDVKTAKIVKVVSVDIRGEIEDVVGKLKDIAEQLVSNAPMPGKTPEVISKGKQEEPNLEKIQEKKIEPEQHKEEVIEEVRPREEPKPTEPPVDPHMQKNKNRSGLQFCLNMFFGRAQEKWHNVYYDASDIAIKETIRDVDSIFPSFNSTPFLNLQLLFSIKLGQLFTIDIGTGFSSGTITYEYGFLENSIPMRETYSNNLTVVSLNTGFNFVKYFHPFKLNIGLTIDGNVLAYSENYKVADEYTVYSDTNSISVGGNASIGLKFGGEILVSKHIGLGVDLRFCRSHFETIAERLTARDGTEFDFSRIIDIPPVGLGVAFHYYY